MSRTEERDPTVREAAGDPVPRRRPMTTGERWTVWIGLVAIAVALLAWQFPRAPAGRTATGGTGTAPSAATLGTGSPAAASTAPSPGGPAPGKPPTYLDALTPQSGGGNLTALPRPLQGQPGYEHPIVIKCPSNASDDKERTVTYPLRGRYLDFSATVRPYFTSQPDSRVDVSAIVGVRERDGTLTQREKGRQFAATMTAPAPLTAAADGAEELTIQVRCEWPEGVVVLTVAGVVPA